MGAQLLDILKYILPSLVVLGASVLVIRMYMKKEEDYRRFELAVKNRDNTLPLRLQAYERLALLMERMMPAALVTRLTPPDISARDYQYILVSNIKQEFEHNLAQQIYVSSAVWTAVNMVKDESIKNINLLTATLGHEGTAQELSRAILKFYMEAETVLPQTTALDLIKNEVKTLF